MKRTFKCTVISDTHCAHRDIEPLKGGDFLFHAGDLSYFGQPGEIEDFMDWFSQQPYRHKVFIAGNHDFGFEPIGEGRLCNEKGIFYFRGRELKKGLEKYYRDMAYFRGIHYLNKEAIELDGVKIYGIPDQPEFCGWAFNYYNNVVAEDIFSRIPEDTNVLLTHGPAFGILDSPSVTSLIGGDDRLGCKILLEHVQRVKPKFHLFGHIHESHGKKKVGDTTHINAAFCSIPYSIHNKPINFTLKLDK